MIELFDEDFDAIELAEGALILNKAVDPETQQHWAELELARLAKEAEQQVFHEVDDKQRLDALLRLFYTEWQFKGDDDEYFSSDNAFIDKVLERRKGVPVSLGSILLYLVASLAYQWKRSLSQLNFWSKCAGRMKRQFTSIHTMVSTLAKNVYRHG